MEEHMYDDTYAVEDGHWWFLNLRKILEQSMRESVKEATGLTILDAGCGTGRNLVFYGRYGRVTGMDISKTGLSYCSRRGIRDLALGDTCRLPFHEETFDVVNSSDVLYAIDPERGADLLKESFRVLRPGGFLFLNTAAMAILNSDHDRAVMTRKRYLKSELVSLITHTRFELVNVRYWNSVLFLPVVVYRLGRRMVHWKTGDTRGDLRNSNRFLNGLLYGIMRMDWRLGGALPFGTSLFCIARKPERNP